MSPRQPAYVLTVTLWSLAACKAHDAAHGSAVSAEDCRASCDDTRRGCSDRCSDEVCRSDCAATARRCGLACDRGSDDAGTDQRDAGDSTHADAGKPQNIPRVTDAAVAADAEPALISAGNDGAQGAGTGAESSAAGGGGSAGGAAGVGDDTGGLGGVAPPGAGSGGYIGVAGKGPVGGFGLPVAGLHGPAGGEQF